MHKYKITIDVAQIFALTVALVVAALGLVDWWVVVLLVLFAVELKFTFRK